MHITNSRMGFRRDKSSTMQLAEPRQAADPISSLVVDALAGAGGTEPSALDPPLYSVVDPDALDALVDRDSPVRVEFEYDGRSVVVRDGGTVVVDGTVHEPSRGVRSR